MTTEINLSSLMQLQRQLPNVRVMGNIVESIVEPAITIQDEELFADIRDVLVRDKQTDVLRQLQGGRRIAVVFPLDESKKSTEKHAGKNALSDAARAYLLWHDITGEKRVVDLAARLGRTCSSRGTDWMMVRSYKDRATNGGWHLRVQPTHPGPRTAAIQMGATPVLSEAWKEVCLQILDTFRFWTALGSQFSLQVAISGEPLKRWEKQWWDVG